MNLYYYPTQLTTCALEIRVRYGSIFESPDERGTAHLIEHMLPARTITHKGRTMPFWHALDLYGVSSFFSTTTEYTVYRFIFHKEDFNEVSGIITQLIGNLKDNEQLEHERRVIESEASEEQNDSFERTVNKYVFGDSLLKRDPLALSSNNTNTSLETLNQLARRYYSNNNLNLVFVGDVPKDRVKDVFRDMGFKDSDQPPVYPRDKTHITLSQQDLVELNSEEETNVRLTHFSVADTDTPRQKILAQIAGTLLNIAFSDFCREGETATYTGELFMAQYTYQTLFEFNTLTRKEKVSQIQGFFEHIEVTSDMVAIAKKIARNTIDFVFDKPASLVSKINEYTLFPYQDSREQKFDRKFYHDVCDSITRDDLLSFINSYTDPKKSVQIIT